MLSMPPLQLAPVESRGLVSGHADGAASTLAGTACTLAGAASGVLDLGALARLTELDPTGNNGLVDRVLRAFKTSVARLRPQLEAARASGDRSAIRSVVHTLKSSSASIGALALSQLCAQIESSVRVDAGADLSAPLVAFDTALDAALLAIDALLKECP